MNFKDQFPNIEFCLSSKQFLLGKFRLMASECEVHVRTSDNNLARKLITLAYDEGVRIEKHFSRYIKNNPLFMINNSQSKAIALDFEYTKLMDYALTLFQISDGMFDISSGVLRKLWTFDNNNHSNQGLPSVEELNDALVLVGLNKISWNPPILKIPAGMELDFGGIGKEYAVDRASQLIEQNFEGDYLVNFGGDCNCRGDVYNPWKIGIETAITGRRENQHVPSNSVTLTTGGVATSGTTKRYFECEGKRYGHILNPKTGWPIEDAPLSVTVINENCLSAGAISTLAMLQGQNAEAFLENKKLLSWVQR